VGSGDQDVTLHFQRQKIRSSESRRYGGEEFCLLLPNTDIGRAPQIGETVRLAVQALAMPHCTSSHQSVSVGVA
jgi:PleD family two-component response regulator